MFKKIKVLVSILLVLCVTLTSIPSAWAANVGLDVKVNTINIKINNASVKIDNFEYKNEYYIQLQDMCSYLNIKYTYSTKTKIANVYNRMPPNSTQASGLSLSKGKANSKRKIIVDSKSATIKIDSKPQKIQNHIFNSKVYVQIKSVAVALGRDYIVDAKTKTVTVNDKKPSTPVIKLSITQRTENDITVDISNWGNAILKEYKIDSNEWIEYKEPFTMTKNGVISARGKNAAKIESDVATYRNDNIRKKATREEVSANNKAVVKIISYDSNHSVIRTGSGFIVSPEGKVVTSYQVISMASDIDIVTIDGKTQKIKGVLDYNTSKDIAILMQEGKETYPYALLGDSSEINVGQDVIAICYPTGLPSTVSFGSVSSIAPDFGRKGYSDVLISMSLLTGSNGGALFNMRSEAVGILFTTTREGQNVSCAIPINDLTPLLKSNTMKSLVEVAKEIHDAMSGADKKPMTPIIHLSDTKQTEGDVSVSIDNWGDIPIKEYKIDDGNWTAYDKPFKVSQNGTVYARGKNLGNFESDIVICKVENIRKKKSKEEVSVANKSVVKIVKYNINHRETGSGSGFFVSNDGKVVTNYHVIDKSTELEVITYDGKTYKVSGVCNYDVEKDLAVLTLENSESPVSLTLGDSDVITVGEETVAIGYPLGLQNTVSFGNISSVSPALSRKGYKDILITAPVSPGSSGGALLNMYGEVIGIIVATMTGAQNMNYAIPVNDLKPMLEGGQLKTPLEVLKEVNKEISYKEMADYIGNNYHDYTVNDTTFEFDVLEVDTYADNLLTLNVYVQLNDAQYRKFMNLNGSNKRTDAERWVNDMINEVKVYYRDKNCTVFLFLHDFYNANPTEFNDTTTDIVEYNSDKGKYEVTHIILVCGYKTSDYTNGMTDMRWSRKW